MANKTTQPKEVKAFARHIHVSPRKLRLVANLVRLAPVDVALEQLRYSSKNAALPLTKVINSAIANAVHNFSLDRDNLYIKSLTVDGGPVLRRYAPRAQGRAFVERKRTSHINIVLESRENTSKRRRSIFSIRPNITTTKEEEKPVINEPQSGEVSSENRHSHGPKPVPRASENTKRSTIGLKRRLFNRKSGE